MMPSFVTLQRQTLHYEFRQGHGIGPTVVFSNSLGTDLRIWDAVIDALPIGTPILCLDKRGHGLSPNGQISIDILAQDMAHLMDHLGLQQVIGCGVSVGGMITQALAAARPDLVKAMVLCCTGLKIGTPEIWTPRIKTVREDGLEAISTSILDRWFTPRFASDYPDAVAGYKAMLVRSDAEGYARTCEAIRDCDLTDRARRLTQPVTCIAGAADQAVPEEVVNQLSTALPDARILTLADVGHLPCIEAPMPVARAIADHLISG